MVQLRFAPELADRVREFVRDESDCCSFFDFAIDELDNEVQLTVYAPQEAQQLLDSLHEVFADGTWTISPTTSTEHGAP